MDIENKETMSFDEQPETQNNSNATESSETIAKPIPSAMSYEEDIEEEQNTEDYSEDDILVARIVESCCGKNEEGQPKAAINFLSEMYSIEKDTLRATGSQSSAKPVIDISKRFDYIHIDLTFPSYLDNDMKIILNLLEKFGKMLNEVTEDTDELPTLSLTVVPVDDNGRYYILMTNPIEWSLCSKRVGEYSKTIGLLFKCEDVGFYETDEIDENEIEAAAQRAAEAHDRQVDILEAKQAEDAAYREERNRKVEELRRNGKF